MMLPDCCEIVSAPCDLLSQLILTAASFFSVGFQDGVERRRWGTRMDSGSATAFISLVHRF